LVNGNCTLPHVRRLWLVRHGVTAWNHEKRFCGHSDVPLSEPGNQQAQWLAGQLHSRSIAALYSSDLQRAQQTATRIAQHHEQLAIRASEVWRELFFGDWEGLTYTQIAEQYPLHTDFFTDPVHTVPPNGEKFPHFRQRVYTALQTLIRFDETIPGDLVLVSHGGVIRLLLCFILGIPVARHWQLRIDPGSLSAIDFVSGEQDISATALLSLLNWQQSSAGID